MKAKGQPEDDMGNAIGTKTPAKAAAPAVTKADPIADLVPNV